VRVKSVMEPAFVNTEKYAADVKNAMECLSASIIECVNIVRNVAEVKFVSIKENVAFAKSAKEIKSVSIADVVICVESAKEVKFVNTINTVTNVKNVIPWVFIRYTAEVQKEEIINSNYLLNSILKLLINRAFTVVPKMAEMASTKLFLARGTR
jgi:hypothetical protein